jgi:hypothetical protein
VSEDARSGTLVKNDPIPIQLGPETTSESLTRFLPKGSTANGRQTLNVQCGIADALPDAGNNRASESRWFV